jgi:hypothetical protein
MVREALELTVSQVNSGTAGEKADAKFGTITALYRTDHMPTLDHSTRANVDYLLRDYIEDKFSKTLGSYRDCPDRRGRIEPGYSGRGSFDRIV